jgi:hypothetical protein
VRRRPHNGRNIAPNDLLHAFEDALGVDTAMSAVLAYGGFFLAWHDDLTQLPAPVQLALDPRPLPAAAAALGKDALASLNPLSWAGSARAAADFARAVAKHPRLDLHTIGRHGRIEHDASLTHDNLAPGDGLYAHVRSNATLWAEFVKDAARPGWHTIEDMGTARARREADSMRARGGKGLDPLHAFLALGESSLVVSIFGARMPGAPGAAHDGAAHAGAAHAGKNWSFDGLGVPAAVLEAFWMGERLPDGWAPARVAGVRSTGAGNRRIRARMEALRAAGAY